MLIFSKKNLKLAAVALLMSLTTQVAVASPHSARPNILIAISDDHSWAHTSAQGSSFVETPSLDSVASSGFLFANAYALPLMHDYAANDEISPNFMRWIKQVYSRPAIAEAFRLGRTPLRERAEEMIEKIVRENKELQS